MKQIIINYGHKIKFSLKIDDSAYWYFRFEIVLEI